MANSRDFTGKNRKFTGTKGIVTPKGTTGQRVGSESGELRFNTTTDLMEYFDGAQWKPIDAPPTISGITTSDSVGSSTVLTADGSTLFTITINGGNFGNGLTVKFIGSTGTEYTAGNITRVSNSQITCKTTASMGTTDDPYDIQVVNTSGLSAELADAFSYNAAPVFTVASGQLGTVYNDQTISGTTLNAGATDAEGNTITFSIISGTLPGTGLTLSSSTGAITGTLASSPSLGNYPFVVQAATTEGIITRQFSIQVVANPFVAATGGTITTVGNYKIHTFTGPGSFVVSSAGTPAGSDKIDYLVVAGGGGGANGDRNGGGGGGGFRESVPSPAAWPASPLANPGGGIAASATTYPITVGGGGAGNSNPGSAGSPSTFSTITSGGGGASGYTSGGQPGGSGGGGPAPSGPKGQGTGNTPPVSPPQGSNGGTGTHDGPNGGSGGGGGATSGGGAGSASPPGTGGVGGSGATTSINNSPTGFSGGGGGGGDLGPRTGGTGGGAPGNTSASSNTGGGGGGTHNTAGDGGNGGSGIVILRYKFQ
jgi:hypothetical protein